MSTKAWRIQMLVLIHMFRGIQLVSSFWHRTLIARPRLEETLGSGSFKACRARTNLPRVWRIKIIQLDFGFFFGIIIQNTLDNLFLILVVFALRRARIITKRVTQHEILFDATLMACTTVKRLLETFLHHI